MYTTSAIKYRKAGKNISFILKKLSSNEDCSGWSFIVILTMLVNLFHDHGFLINEEELEKAIKIIPKKEFGELKKETILKDFLKIVCK